MVLHYDKWFFDIKATELKYAVCLRQVIYPIFILLGQFQKQIILLKYFLVVLAK